MWPFKKKKPTVEAYNLEKSEKNNQDKYVFDNIEELREKAFSEWNRKIMNIKQLEQMISEGEEITIYLSEGIKTPDFSKGFCGDVRDVFQNTKEIYSGSFKHHLTNVYNTSCGFSIKNLAFFIYDCNFNIQELNLMSGNLTLIIQNKNKVIFANKFDMDFTSENSRLRKEQIFEFDTHADGGRFTIFGSDNSIDQRDKNEKQNKIKALKTLTAGLTTEEIKTALNLK